MTQPDTYWNAELYDRLNKPHRVWAQAILDELALNGDETVLDAGCGSGSVTFMLLDRLPNGKLYAVDGSPEMIEQITASIAERELTNIEPIQADLTNFTLREPVDVIFSNAVFHWIHDDDGLFGSLLRAAKPGGRLRAQCGGGDNIAKLMLAVDSVSARDPFAEHLTGIDEARNYRTPESAVAAMERVGWADARADTYDVQVELPDLDEADAYLRTIILRGHIRHLPESHHDAYTSAVLDEYIERNGPPFTVDYVRLNLWATRPTAT
ncbi:MAG: methyltransferase domain-containing protein [Chloroflexi bacterium]|nr:methyltransferase domain-containing protein [Chloroflexota bacterium]